MPVGRVRFIIGIKEMVETLNSNLNIEKYLKFYKD
jgi:hypothetical protein